jgi:hypothetical protein
MLLQLPVREWLTSSGFESLNRWGKKEIGEGEGYSHTLCYRSQVRFYAYLVASVVCGVLDFLIKCSTCHLSSTGLYV